MRRRGWGTTEDNPPPQGITDEAIRKLASNYDKETVRKELYKLTFPTELELDTPSSIVVRLSKQYLRIARIHGLDHRICSLLINTISNRETDPELKKAHLNLAKGLRHSVLKVGQTLDETTKAKLFHLLFNVLQVATNVVNPGQDQDTAGRSDDFILSELLLTFCIMREEYWGQLGELAWDINNLLVGRDIKNRLLNNSHHLHGQVHCNQEYRNKQGFEDIIDREQFITRQQVVQQESVEFLQSEERSEACSISLNDLLSCMDTEQEALDQSILRSQPSPRPHSDISPFNIWVQDVINLARLANLPDYYLYEEDLIWIAEKIETYCNLDGTVAVVTRAMFWPVDLTTWRRISRALSSDLSREQVVQKCWEILLKTAEKGQKLPDFVVQFLFRVINSNNCTPAMKWSSLKVIHAVVKSDISILSEERMTFVRSWLDDPVLGPTALCIIILVNEGHVEISEFERGMQLLMDYHDPNDISDELINPILSFMNNPANSQAVFGYCQANDCLAKLWRLITSQNTPDLCKLLQVKVYNCVLQNPYSTGLSFEQVRAVVDELDVLPRSSDLFQGMFFTMIIALNENGRNFALVPRIIPLLDSFPPLNYILIVVLEKLCTTRQIATPNLNKFLSFLPSCEILRPRSATDFSSYKFEPAEDSDFERFPYTVSYQAAKIIYNSVKTLHDQNLTGPSELLEIDSIQQIISFLSTNIPHHAPQAKILMAKVLEILSPSIPCSIEEESFSRLENLVHSPISDIKLPVRIAYLNLVASSPSSHRMNVVTMLYMPKRVLLTSSDKEYSNLVNILVLQVLRDFATMQEFMFGDLQFDLLNGILLSNQCTTEQERILGVEALGNYVHKPNLVSSCINFHTILAIERARSFPETASIAEESLLKLVQLGCPVSHSTLEWIVSLLYTEERCALAASQCLEIADSTHDLDDGMYLILEMERAGESLNLPQFSGQSDSPPVEFLIRCLNSGCKLSSNHFQTIQRLFVAERAHVPNGVKLLLAAAKNGQRIPAVFFKSLEKLFEASVALDSIIPLFLALARTNQKIDDGIFIQFQTYLELNPKSKHYTDILAIFLTNSQINGKLVNGEILHKILQTFGKEPAMEDLPGIVFNLEGMFKGNGGKLEDGIPQLAEIAIINNMKAFMSSDCLNLCLEDALRGLEIIVESDPSCITLNTIEFLLDVALSSETMNNNEKRIHGIVNRCMEKVVKGSKLQLQNDLLGLYFCGDEQFVSKLLDGLPLYLQKVEIPILYWTRSNRIFEKKCNSERKLNVVEKLQDCLHQIKNIPDLLLCSISKALIQEDPQNWCIFFSKCAESGVKVPDQALAYLCEIKNDTPPLDLGKYIETLSKIRDNQGQLPSSLSLIVSSDLGRLENLKNDLARAKQDVWLNEIPPIYLDLVKNTQLDEGAIKLLAEIVAIHITKGVQGVQGEICNLIFAPLNMPPPLEVSPNLISAYTALISSSELSDDGMGLGILIDFMINNTDPESPLILPILECFATLLAKTPEDAPDECRNILEANLNNSNACVRFNAFRGLQLEKDLKFEEMCPEFDKLVNILQSAQLQYFGPSGQGKVPQELFQVLVYCQWKLRWSISQSFWVIQIATQSREESIPEIMEILENGGEFAMLRLKSKFWSRALKSLPGGESAQLHHELEKVAYKLSKIWPCPEPILVSGLLNVIHGFEDFSFPNLSELLDIMPSQPGNEEVDITNRINEWKDYSTLKEILISEKTGAFLQTFDACKENIVLIKELKPYFLWFVGKFSTQGISQCSERLRGYTESQLRIVANVFEIMGWYKDQISLRHVTDLLLTISTTDCTNWAKVCATNLAQNFISEQRAVETRPLVGKLFQGNRTNPTISFLSPTNVEINHNRELLELLLSQIKDTRATSNVAFNNIPICAWNADQILAWAQMVKGQVVELDISIREILSVIRRGHELQSNLILTDVQLISCLISLKKDADAGLGMQVVTGAGKSLIISSLAVIFALRGHSVDIITSSPVLAERDFTENRGFYGKFGLSSSCNIDKFQYTSGPKDSYVNKRSGQVVDIVIGDTSQFQFDYLRDAYYNEGTLGGRVGGVAIVDEVDSLLIDGCTKVAKLSSSTPGFDLFLPLYYLIWSNLEDAKNRIVVLEENLYFVHGKLFQGEDGLRCQFQGEEEEVTVNLGEWFKFATSEQKLRFLIQLEDPVVFLKTELVRRVRQLICNTGIEGKFNIPACLFDFVTAQLPIWVDNALTSLNMAEDVNYIVSNEGLIKPVEYRSTGIIQESTNWSNGLHQFLQIQNGLNFSPETLTTNFLSVPGYFKKYGNNIIGLTGTLGSENSQEFLRRVYSIRSVIIPEPFVNRFKLLPPVIQGTTATWRDAIIRSALLQSQSSRGTLLICESIATAENMADRLKASGKVTGTVKLYTMNNMNQEGLVSEVKRGDVIVSTMLASRGTHIAANDLDEIGGLHVILSFYPQSSKVLWQVLGRTARQGKPGSGQLIIHDGRKYGILEEVAAQAELASYDHFHSTHLPDIAMKDDMFNGICARNGRVRETIRGQVKKKRNVLTDVSVWWKSTSATEERLYFSEVEGKWAMFLWEMNNSNLSNEEKQLKFHTLCQTIDGMLNEGEVRVSSPFANIGLGNYYFVNSSKFQDRIPEAAQHYITSINADPLASPAGWVGLAACALKLEKNYFDQIQAVVGGADVVPRNCKQFAKFCLRRAMNNLENENGQLLFCKSLIPQSGSRCRSGKKLAGNDQLSSIERRIEIATIYLDSVKRLLQVVTKSQKLFEVMGFRGDECISINGNDREGYDPDDLFARLENYTRYELTFNDLTRHEDILVSDQALDTVKSLKEFRPVLTLKSVDSEIIERLVSKHLVFKSLSKSDALDLLTRKKSMVLNKKMACPGWNWQSGRINLKIMAPNNHRLISAVLNITIDEGHTRVKVQGEGDLFSITFLESNAIRAAELESCVFTLQTPELSMQSALHLLSRIQPTSGFVIQLNGNRIDLAGFEGDTILKVIQKEDTVQTSRHIVGDELNVNSFNSLKFPHLSRERAKSLVDCNPNCMFEIKFQIEYLQLIEFLRPENLSAEVPRFDFVIEKISEQTGWSSTVIEYTRAEQIDFSLGFKFKNFEDLKRAINVVSIKQENIIIQAPKLLEDYFSRNQCPIQILQDCYARGLQFTFQGNENNPIPWISIGVLVGIASIQMALGAALIATGLGASLGWSLVTEGAVDLMLAFNAYRTRELSWSDYGLQKAISLTISVATLGFSALSKASKAIEVGGTSIVKTVGTNVLSEGMEQVGTRVVKTGVKAVAAKGNVGVKTVLKTVVGYMANKACLTGINLVANVALDAAKSKVAEYIEQQIQGQFLLGDLHTYLSRLVAAEKILGIDGNPLTTVMEGYVQDFTNSNFTFGGKLVSELFKPLQTALSQNTASLTSSLSLALRVICTLQGLGKIYSVILPLTEFLTKKLTLGYDQSKSKIRIYQRLKKISYQDAAAVIPDENYEQNPELNDAMKRIGDAQGAFHLNDISRVIRLVADLLTDKIFSIIESDMILPWASFAGDYGRLSSMDIFENRVIPFLEGRSPLTQSPVGKIKLSADQIIAELVGPSTEIGVEIGKKIFIKIPAWKSISKINCSITFYRRSSNNSENVLELSCSEAENVQSCRELFTGSHLDFLNTPRLAVICHGFRNSKSESWLERMKDEILSFGGQDKTVAIICWKGGAQLYLWEYNKAVANLFPVGDWVASVIQNLSELRPQLRFYGIGHSLGAHVLGLAGKKCKKFSRITGLDPAQPILQSQLVSLPLGCESGDMVDVIHTCSKFGTMLPCGTLDFYPNFGQKQPGVAQIANILGGSHRKAYDYFIKSINAAREFKTSEVLDGVPTRNWHPTAAILQERTAQMGYHADRESNAGVGENFWRGEIGRPSQLLFYIGIDQFGREVRMNNGL